MASQRFCLRWNNHQSNMLSVFDQLLHAETFTDVTLAVEGQLLKAHKIVLSACSPYFQALFVNHQEKHPIVILKDVPYSDMKSLLDFMYRGEVSVDQERLTAFLRVAESLRIKGLTEVNEEKCDIPALTNSLLQQQQQQQTAPAHTPPPQLHRIHQHYMAQKRPAAGAHMGGAPPNLLMPLLGNALLQPKRKRGRPRKLSGSSSDALAAAASPPCDLAAEVAAHAQASTRASDHLLRGSPEMLEVKMGTEGFGEDGSGEEGGEALLIDEDTEPRSAATPTPSKDSESAGRGTPDSEVKYESPSAREGKIRVNPATQATTSADYQSDSLNNNTLPTVLSHLPRQVRRRVRRRANSASNDPAEQLTEMSVRGLNLFRYASVSEGVYQCTECAKENIQKTFKNKYSFQRHAFLYHEGHQRKVFPCPVCAKEFSRPDKMKNHMKTTHDCYVPKDMFSTNAFYMSLQGLEPLPPGLKFEALPTGVKFEAQAYHYMSYEEDEHHPDVPIITLEVISRDSDCYYTARSGQPTQYYEEQMAEANTQVIQERGGGGGELTPKMEPQETEETERIDQGETSGSSTESVKSKSDLLEYLLRNDGSVVCKLCGEILQSRTHWYRHKYKLHVVPALNPSPLFQCEQCLVYFKSRKGYIGHIASRHGELSESPGAQPPPVQPPEVVITPVRMKQETPEPEVQPAGPAYTTTVSVTQSTKHQTEGNGRKTTKSITSDEYLIRAADAEWEQRRSREEKLVADIIDRVRRECEAQGAGGATRRGYTRRTTVMNT